MPYCNNLRKDDLVEVAKSKRRGAVHNQREDSVNVLVLLDGIATPRYFHISELRLVLDDKAEDVAPCDGEPPARPDDHAPAEHLSPLDQLLRTRRGLVEKLTNVDEHIVRLLAAPPA